MAALSTVAAIPLSILANQNVDGAIAVVIGVPAAAVGAVVARRLPRNPLGWLLLAIGTCLVLANDGSDYALLAYRLGHRLPLGMVALGVNQLWGPAIELLVLVILLFPDGTLASPAMALGGRSVLHTSMSSKSRASPWRRRKRSPGVPCGSTPTAARTPPTTRPAGTRRPCTSVTWLSWPSCWPSSPARC